MAQALLLFRLLRVRFSFCWECVSLCIRLGRSSACQEMKEEREYGKHQQQVDQTAGDMKHQESATPCEQ